MRYSFRKLSFDVYRHYDSVMVRSGCIAKHARSKGNNADASLHRKTSCDCRSALVSRGVLQIMSIEIDQSVYPDLDHPPAAIETPEDKADYLHRICAAWDFGVLPSAATFDLFADWQDVFDRFPMVTSPAYHAFRCWFRWPPVDMPVGLPAITPRWLHLDRLEGRQDDPCEKMI